MPRIYAVLSLCKGQDKTQKMLLHKVKKRAPNGNLARS